MSSGCPGFSNFIGSIILQSIFSNTDTGRQRERISAAPDDTAISATPVNNSGTPEVGSSGISHKVLGLHVDCGAAGPGLGTRGQGPAPVFLPCIKCFFPRFRTFVIFMVFGRKAFGNQCNWKAFEKNVGWTPSASGIAAGPLPLAALVAI